MWVKEQLRRKKDSLTKNKYIDMERYLEILSCPLMINKIISLNYLFKFWNTTSVETNQSIAIKVPNVYEPKKKI